MDTGGRGAASDDVPEDVKDGWIRRAGLSGSVVQLRPHPACLVVADLPGHEVRYQEAIELEVKTRWTEAIERFQAALEIDDQFADLHLRLTRCLRAVDDYRRALEHDRRARDLDALTAESTTSSAKWPISTPMAHHNLGCALRSEGQLDEAIRHFEIALQLKPDYAAASRNMARTVQLKAQRQEPTRTAP